MVEGTRRDERELRVGENVVVGSERDTECEREGRRKIGRRRVWH